MFSAETRRQAAAFDAIGERYDDVFPHKSGQIIATQWMIDRLPSGARATPCGTSISFSSTTRVSVRKASLSTPVVVVNFGWPKVTTLSIL